MVSKFCKVCKKETKHRKLIKTGFFTQCLMSFRTNFNIDLREHDHECNSCGNQTNA